MTAHPQARVNPFDDERPVEKFELTEGNSITGVLVSVEERSSDYGPEPYLYLVIDDESTGKLMGVPAWHFGLRSQLATQQPQPGERIRIKVGEKTKTANGQTFQKYTLRVDRPQPPRVDYSREQALTGTVPVSRDGVLKFPDEPKSASPFDDDDNDLPF